MPNRGLAVAFKAYIVEKVSIGCRVDPSCILVLAILT